MRFSGESGRAYVTSDSPFFCDEEGDYYALEGAEGRAVKTLRSSVQWRVLNRVRRQIEFSVPDRVKNEICWPVDVVHSRGGVGDGELVGYVLTCMPEGVPISKLYGYFPSMHFGSKVRVAENLCIAVKHAHETGWVVGDMNPRNILVDAGTCRVFIAETGVRLERGKFLGPGTSEWLPVDLQGVDLCSLRSGGHSEESDRYALAVHVFALLSRGWHPMSFARNGSDSIRNLSNERKPEESPRQIAEMSYALPRWDIAKGTYPVRRYRLSSLRFPLRLSRCFRRAFGTGSGRSDSCRQPAEEELLRGLRALGRRPRAMLSMLIDHDARQNEGAGVVTAADEDARDAVLRVGVEAGRADLPISDERVYGRVTLALALLTGLSYCFGSPGRTAPVLAAALEGLGLTTALEYSVGVALAIAGSLAGLACVRVFRQVCGRRKTLTLRSYFIAFVCSVAGSFLLPVACFWMREMAVR